MYLVTSVYLERGNWLEGRRLEDDRGGIVRSQEDPEVPVD